MTRLPTLAFALLLLVLLPAAAQAKDKTVWVCNADRAGDLCKGGLGTTQLDNSGQMLAVEKVKRVKKPKFDCFYIYPTVSDDDGGNSDLSIDPEERSIVLYQAARYSQVCRVFAPMYRQITLTQLLKGPDTISDEMSDTAYNSALWGWKDFLRNHSKGRPFVLIGHSQGSFVLRRLIKNEIDSKPALRKRLVSALLLGGNVLVKKGKGSGGDFKNVSACRKQSQVGCVVAFSVFNDPVPSDALFGRLTGGLQQGETKGMEVLCAYPGSRKLKTVLPSEPFAPESTIGIATTLLGYPAFEVSTPWVEFDQGYTGSCSSADGANVLQVKDLADAPHLNPVPDATWGLHLVDANIALGNLIELVARQAKAYFKRIAK